MDSGHNIKPIQIENRLIGPGHPVFIIAEIGVNHNGDKVLAKRTIEAAARAGADCVKFQTWRTEEFMADRDLEYEYVSGGGLVKEKMYDMFKRLELPLQWHQELFDHARNLGLVPLTSVADPLSTDAALEAGVKALKLASEDLINLPLLEYVAAKDVPLILSTGMADEIEIKDALEIMKHYHALSRTIFLHCVSLYPTKDGEANLLRMQAIQEVTGCIPGYSDHTIGPEACLGAVALGACVLEKHFTLDKGLPGPDHAMSADPKELMRLVSMIRRIDNMLGQKILQLSEREAEVRNTFRRSIVAARDLLAGERLKAEDLSLKRPGYGMQPRNLSNIIGKKIMCNIKKNERIVLNFFDDEYGE
ncbi:N-acetylneuraminate synthase [Desulfonatronum thiosulfatophilum]|uniref:N-acetylneuraminate synthase n=2 Tax=Desulfonatronum thiosulfatophilum TaxID=617002 RepID=A0A1G6DV11_9BACT|nr:N-acetylneuraminate synthase family protein [Desulfonatronum thiosulfatophilum]SDB48961.1 N-acetylneuraminate synthase [Desulfonatronum thiosulfatophilum]